MTGDVGISILVPVYNGERYLGEALASILAQSSGADEVLVIDDGSDDGSAALARRHRGVRVHSVVHGGKSAAMNAGIRAAERDWLAFLDADDVWTPHKLALQRGAIAGDDGLEAVFGYVEEFVSPDIDDAVRRRLRPAPQPMRGYTSSAALLRRSVFDRVGLFDEGLGVGEFIDWMARARDVGLRETTLSETLVRRRLHGANLSLTQPAKPQNLLPVLRRMLARRRDAGHDPSSS